MHWTRVESVWWYAGSPKRNYVVPSLEREGMWFAEANRVQQYFATLKEAKAWVEAMHALGGS